MIWLPIAAQLAATGAGLIGSAQDNAKTNRMIAGRKNDITQLFNNEAYSSFADTEMGASQVRSLQDLYDKQVKQADQSLSNTGATSEAKIAARDKAADNYSEGLNKLTAYGTNYRDSLRRDYQNQLNAMFSLELQQQAGKQSTWSALLQNAGQLSAGLEGVFTEK
jgi:hypothetical protein